MKKYNDATSVVSVAIKKGILQKMPCRDCGGVLVEAHHPDYSKPLSVIWLCRKHHADEHKRLRNAGVVLNRLKYAKSAVITMRLQPRLLNRLCAMAKAQGRTTSNLAILILQEAVNGKKSVR